MSATAPRGRAEGSLRPRAPRLKARHRESFAGWLFTAPNLILLSLFLFLPILWALQLSFQETRGFGDPEWVGLANYSKLISDDVFWLSLFNTLVFAAVTVPLDMIFGLGLAVLLNSVIPARGVFRTMIILPMVISGVASGMIGVLIFYQTNGVINKVLVALGAEPIAWQSDGVPAMISVMAISVWLRVGFNMIIYLAGLQGISPELYEAARIDGASKWQQFRSITVPLVGPSSFFLLIMNVIASFQIFDLIFVMTGGGPGNSTSVLVTYAYRNGFEIREQGYGAAIGMVILVITLIFTFIQWKTNRSRDMVE